MYYFDYLRASRSLKIYAIVLACSLLFELVSLAFSHSSHGDTTIGLNSEALRLHEFNGYQMLHELGSRITIPFAFICAFAACIAGLYAFGTSTSLARFNRNLHFSFAKPVSRERAALTTIAFDALSILAAFAIALVFLLVPVAATGLLGRITFDAHVAANIALGLGGGFMWYAIVQAVTATMRGGAGLVMGLSWAVFALLRPLQLFTASEVTAPVVWILHALERLNPFAYIHTLFDNLDGFHGGVSPLDPGLGVDLATVWIATLVFLAVAVAMRRRMEV